MMIDESSAAEGIDNERINFSSLKNEKSARAKHTIGSSSSIGGKKDDRPN